MYDYQLHGWFQAPGTPLSTGSVRTEPPLTAEQWMDIFLRQNHSFDRNVPGPYEQGSGTLKWRLVSDIGAQIGGS
jgi:hypothetical protein